MVYRYFTVEYVDMAEATPRTTFAKTVRTESGTAVDAREIVLTKLILDGVNAQILDVHYC